MFYRVDWLTYLSSYSGKVPVLYKGFPMVEDVVFAKHPNYWTCIKDHGKLVPDGPCYWTALALLLYGNASLWLRVKAEHLSFLKGSWRTRGTPSTSSTPKTIKPAP